MDGRILQARPHVQVDLMGGATRVGVPHGLDHVCKRALWAGPRVGRSLQGWGRGSPYFFSTISEAPLLYMRKLSSGSLMTVLMDLRTELKVYTLYNFSSGIWLRTGS